MSPESLQFTAQYFDGRSSRAESVVVHVVPGSEEHSGELHIQPVNAIVAFSDITITPRIGDASRRILLPEGAALESRHNDLIDQLAVLANKQQEGVLYKLESLWAYALAALVTLVVCSYFFVTTGLPMIAHSLAQRVPEKVVVQMVDQIMPELDQHFLQASSLSEEEQSELTDIFNALLPDESPHNYRLLFRSSAYMGANAFALPDGTIVMLDGLVDLADHPEQLSGILLHEIAHVEHRHGLEGLIKRAGLAAFIFAYTGDIALANELVILIPAFLLEAGYSRDAESESDQYAIDYMLANNMPLGEFESIMQRLFFSVDWDDDGSQRSSGACKRPEDLAEVDGEEGDEGETEVQDSTAESQEAIAAVEPQANAESAEAAIQAPEEGRRSIGETVFGYLSTHPPSKERIERIRQAALAQ